MYRTHAACPFKHWNLLHSSEGFLTLQYLNISITASVNIDVIRYCFSFFFFQFKFVMMLEFFQEVHVCNKPFHTDSLSQESFWNTSLFAHLKGYNPYFITYPKPLSSSFPDRQPATHLLALMWKTGWPHWWSPNTKYFLVPEPKQCRHLLPHQFFYGKPSLSLSVSVLRSPIQALM